eukprot:TRINITY_DN2704_c0_g1_i1.p1 TRINITY_DN2704_c0_g1~~TRINITY_DN2704_c0_g1_i1.p1  ORF type:complete len:508 (-),score=127.74 TRINITY_DN2704_c0_g1_i1:217-1740(-)
MRLSSESAHRIVKLLLFSLFLRTSWAQTSEGSFTSSFASTSNNSTSTTATNGTSTTGSTGVATTAPVTTAVATTQFATTAFPSQYTQYAHCHLIGAADSSVSGEVLFLGSGAEVTMTVSLKGIDAVGLLPAQVGIHIHAFGDVSVDGSPGGVYNPFGAVTRGCPPAARFVGDTGNWNLSRDGTIVQTKVLNLIQLTGAGSIVGRSVIVQTITDDCTSPVNASARLAWGVIGVGNGLSSTESVTANSAVNGASDVVNGVCSFSASQTSSLSGTVWFQPDPVVPGNVLVTARVSGLGPTASPRALTIHQFGDLSGGGSTFSGPHFNPAGSAHAVPPVTPRHVGDLGNIYFYDATSGASWYRLSNPLVSLNGTLSSGVVGRSVVLHAFADSCSQPDGGSGPGVAACVIGISGPPTLPALPSLLPLKQNGCAPPPPSPASVLAPAEASAFDIANPFVITMIVIGAVLIVVIVVAIVACVMLMHKLRVANSYSYDSTLERYQAQAFEMSFPV